MSLKTLSIIIPCYNEENRLKTTWDKISAYADKIEADVTYVFVNDWSQDQTLRILQSIAENTDLKVDVISYEHNRWKWYAVKQGVFAKDTDYYLIMDADGATKLSEINTFLEYKEEAEILIGSRISHLAWRKWYKRLLGAVAHTIITKTLWLKNIRDTQCGFKMFSHEVKYLWNEMRIERRGFDFEFLYLAKQNKIKVLEIEVDWFDVWGSKIELLDYIKTLWELYRAYIIHKWKMIRNSLKGKKKKASQR